MPFSDYCYYEKINDKFTVSEDWWISKPEIIKSKITSIFCKSVKVYARNCKIEKIDKETAKKFLNENHIYGATVSKHQIGLIIDNRLIAVATFAAQRKFSSGKSAEMLRFCNKNNTTVIGGLSKLIKTYFKLYQPDDIMTYADIDWGSGEAFKKIGFTETQTKDGITFHCNILTGERVSSKHFNDYDNVSDYEKLTNSGSIKFVLDLRNFGN